MKQAAALLLMSAACLEAADPPHAILVNPGPHGDGIKVQAACGPRVEWGAVSIAKFLQGKTELDFKDVEAALNPLLLAYAKDSEPI